MPRREPGNRCCGAVLEAVTKSEQAEDARLGRMLHQPGEGATLGFPALGGYQQLARLQALLFEHAPVAQRHLQTIQRSCDAATPTGLPLLHLPHDTAVGFTSLSHTSGPRVFHAPQPVTAHAQYPRFLAIPRLTN